MKKIVFIILAIWLSVIITIVFLPLLLPAKVAPIYSDKQLRELAKSSALLSNPSSLGELELLVGKLDLQKIRLGRELYFDQNLSKGKDVSCATCHLLPQHKTDGLGAVLLDNKKSSDCAACHVRDVSGVDRFSFSVGTNGIHHPQKLNTQTVLNSAFARHYTWSGEVTSIKEEILASFGAKHKMQLVDDASLSSKAEAIESFVKTLITRGDYDRFLDGNDSAMTPQAKRGLANFINFGCKGCHGGREFGGLTIQKFPLKSFAQPYNFRLNIELFPQPRIIDTAFPFENGSDFYGKESRHLFRVPMLRNVTKTSPYFHNGSVAKLREAVEIMAKYQLGRDLQPEQIDEIVAFLGSLDGDLVEYEK